MTILIYQEDEQFLLTHPTPDDFLAIQSMCQAVYPSSPPWSLEQLQSHAKVFPEGQLVCFEKTTGQVVGVAFSLIISWDDYETDQSWRVFTDAGLFGNHDPQNGRTLYGAEVMSHPDFQGQGIGSKLYEARREIVDKLGLLRIRAGARLRGYSVQAGKMTPQQYVRAVLAGELSDPTLNFQLSRGFVALDVVKDYLKHDPESLGYAAVIEWLNPTVAEPRHFEAQRAAVELLMKV